MIMGMVVGMVMGMVMPVGMSMRMPARSVAMSAIRANVIDLAEGRAVVEGFGHAPCPDHVGLCQHLCRRAPGDGLPRQQQRFGEMCPDHGQIVQHGHHRPALIAPAADQHHEVVDRGIVDGGKRLVEQDHRRILKAHPGKQCALQLPAGQGADRASLETGQAHQCQRMADRIGVRAPEGPEKPAPLPQAHGHQIEHGDGIADIDAVLLRHVGKLPAHRQIADDATAQRLEFADQPAQQGGLAGPVRPDDGQEAARRDQPAEVVDGGMPVIAKRQVLEPDGGNIGHGTAGWRLGQGHGHGTAMAQKTASQIRPTSRPASASLSGADMRIRDTCGAMAGTAGRGLMRRLIWGCAAALPRRAHAPGWQGHAPRLRVPLPAMC